MNPASTKLPLLLLAMSVTGCEVIDSEDVATGDVIADISAHRLTTIDESATSSNIDFIVVLREDAGNKPYLDLTGGDTLELLVNSVAVEFRRDDSALNTIRYLAEWKESLPDPSSLTVRFIRGTGEAHDSEITTTTSIEFMEPDPGFAWNPNVDNLVADWEAAEPPVDNGLVTTSCTEDEFINNITSQSFTLSAGSIVRNSTNTNPCPGFVELTQEPLEGSVATELNDASTFTLDQATRIAVEAQY